MIVAPSSTKKGKQCGFGTKALLDTVRTSHYGLFNCGASSLTLGVEVLRETPTESSQFQPKNRAFRIGRGLEFKGRQGVASWIVVSVSWDLYNLYVGGDAACGRIEQPISS